MDSEPSDWDISLAEPVSKPKAKLLNNNNVKQKSNKSVNSDPSLTDILEEFSDDVFKPKKSKEKINTSTTKMNNGKNLGKSPPSNGNSFTNQNKQTENIYSDVDNEPNPNTFKHSLLDNNGSSEKEAARPGREKKGHKYDPPTPPARYGEHNGSDHNSWDDSDNEKAAMAEIRAKFLRKAKSGESPNGHKGRKATGGQNGSTNTSPKQDTKQPGGTRPQEPTDAGPDSEKKPRRPSKKTKKDQKSGIEEADRSMQPEGSGSPPDETVVTMNLVEETSAMKKYLSKDTVGKRQLYFFDEGSNQFYEVLDDDVEAVLPNVADKMEKIAQRIWREVFAVLRIVIGFFIVFVVELFRYVAHHIAQPLSVGVILVFGNFILKPFLAAIYNGLMQPVIVFSWNLMVGVRHVFDPISDILRKVFMQFALLLRSVRMFEITPPSKARTKGMIEDV